MISQPYNKANTKSADEISKVNSPFIKTDLDLNFLLNIILIALKYEIKFSLEIQTPFFSPVLPDVNITYADISKGKRDLCYEPKIKLEEGLKRLYESL